MKKHLLNLLFIFLTLTLWSQKHWQLIDQNDGLLSNDLKHFVAETTDKWWVATDISVSLIENATQISNFFPTGLDVNNDQILDLEYAQNKLWIATTNGLYSFDGGSFLKYGTTNGLGSNRINAIASASNGDLWIATLQGVSRFDGQNFTHHDSIRAQFIEVDGNDRVYAFRLAGIYNIPGLTFVFDSFQWVDYSSLTNQSYTGSKFYSFDGKVYLSSVASNGRTGFLEITYPNRPQFKAFTNITSSLSGVFWKSDELSFLGVQSSFGLGFLQTRDSVLSYSPLPVQINEIGNSNDKIIFCTKQGLVYADLSIKTPLQIDTLDLNEVVHMTNELNTPFANSNPNLSWVSFGIPKNNPVSTIYNLDVMFVGRDDSTLNFAGTPIYGNSLNRGPVHNQFFLDENYMFKISKQEVLDHIVNYNQPNYQMPRSIKNWPAVGDSSIGIGADLAPFVDHNQNGCYDPENGDYPMMKGDEAIYWIRHYPDPNLKLEYHTMLYAYHNPQLPELNQSQFLWTRIVNRGNVDYDSTKLGIFLDGDLGNAADDYIGCDSSNSIFYFYNGDSLDESFANIASITTNIPAVGVKLLRKEMTNFVPVRISGPVGDPSLPTNLWKYVNSRNLAGKQLTYSDFGWASNQAVNMVLAGDPYLMQGWTERTPAGGIPNQPGDRSVMASFDHFTLQSGESVDFELVVGYGQKSSVNSHYENVPELIRVLNVAGDYYDTLTSASYTYGQKVDCPQAIGLKENQEVNNSIRLYPNPTKELINLESEMEIDLIQLFSISGQKVSEIPGKGKQHQLNVGNLEKGLYLLRYRLFNGQWMSAKLIKE